MQTQPFCRQCGEEETSFWRSGPLGPGTLCNACGVHSRRCLVPDCDRCTRTGICGDFALRARRHADDAGDNELSDQPEMINMPSSPADAGPNVDPAGPSPVTEPSQDPGSPVIRRPGSAARPMVASMAHQPPALPPGNAGVLTQPLNAEEAGTSSGPAADDNTVQEESFDAPARLRLQRNIAADCPSMQTQVKTASNWSQLQSFFSPMPFLPMRLTLRMSMPTTGGCSIANCKQPWPSWTTK